MLWKDAGLVAMCIGAVVVMVEGVDARPFCKALAATEVLCDEKA